MRHRKLVQLALYKHYYSSLKYPLPSDPWNEVWEYPLVVVCQQRWTDRLSSLSSDRSIGPPLELSIGPGFVPKSKPKSSRSCCIVLLHDFFGLLPSPLKVSLKRQAGMLLAGFLRGQSIYLISVSVWYGYFNSLLLAASPQFLIADFPQPAHK